MYHIVSSFPSRKRRPGKLYRQVTVCRLAFRGCCSAVDAFPQPLRRGELCPSAASASRMGWGVSLQLSVELATSTSGSWCWPGASMKPDPSSILMCESSCQLHLPSCLPRLNPPIPSARIYSLSSGVMKYILWLPGPGCYKVRLIDVCEKTLRVIWKKSENLFPQANQLRWVEKFIYSPTFLADRLRAPREPVSHKIRSISRAVGWGLLPDTSRGAECGCSLPSVTLLLTFLSFLRVVCDFNRKRTG